VQEIHSTLQFVDTGHAVARLESGGCIIGPIIFFKEDGSVLKKIDAGIHIPTGCGQ